MITANSSNGRKRSGESGQALVFLVLALGLAFLAAGAFSVDMSNLWFHRQAAQNAADAACTAGAMDLLVGAQGGATGHQGFTAGTSFSCTGSSAMPCQYAAKNGYGSDGTGNLVQVSFPTTVTGVPTGSVPPSGLAPNAFMRVDVTDNVQTYFSGMLSGNRTQPVRAFAACGVVLAQAPIPILVLDPHNPSTSPPSKALDIQGTPTIKIVGGPTQSIQVNSDSTTAVNVGGSASIDLTKGGPGFNGSDFGTYGGPATAPGGFVTANGGKWMNPSSPIADPFAQIPAPAQPAAPAALTSPVCSSNSIQNGNCNVAYHDAIHGCPDSVRDAFCIPPAIIQGYYRKGLRWSAQGATDRNFNPALLHQQRIKAGLKTRWFDRERVPGDGSGGTILLLDREYRELQRSNRVGLCRVELGQRVDRCVQHRCGSVSRRIRA